MGEKGHCGCTRHLGVHPSASTASTLARAAAPHARPRGPSLLPARGFWGSGAVGAARGGCGGAARHSQAGAKIGRRRRRRPQPAGPAAPRRGLRHVPRPAGAAAAAAASVRACRGRRSTPPASFVRILGRGRRPRASTRPCAPACPGRRARAHSAPDSLRPRADAEEGVGAGPRVTRTRRTNRSARGLPRGPAPGTHRPSAQWDWGSRATLQGLTQGGLGLGRPRNPHSFELRVRLDGGRNKRCVQTAYRLLLRGL